MGEDRLRVGLIGAGRIGRLHAEHLARHIPRAELAVVADSNETSAAECARQCGISRTVSDPKDVLERHDVDAVVICSPTDTHARLIEAAAGAGKPVFCEKPIALDPDEIDRALSAVARAGVLLQIGFNRRFDAEYARVRRAIQSGEIGEVHLLHLISRDPAPPPIEYIRWSGGLFVDMAIHDFDMARFLTGDEVEEVYAAGAVRCDPEIGKAGDIDTAVTMLRFRSGVLATIDNSRRAVYGYDQRVEAFGSGGAIRTENRHPSTAVVADAAGVRRDLPLNFFMERYRESYLAEMVAFIDAAQQGLPAPVSGQDGKAAVHLALAARRSLEANRPIRVEAA